MWAGLVIQLHSLLIVLVLRCSYEPQDMLRLLERMQESNKVVIDEGDVLFV